MGKENGGEGSVSGRSRCNSGHCLHGGLSDTRGLIRGDRGREEEKMDGRRDGRKDGGMDGRTEGGLMDGWMREQVSKISTL